VIKSKHNPPFVIISSHGDVSIGRFFYTCRCSQLNSPLPKIIDPVFAKTSQNARFLLSENERFGLVFVKTGSINSGT
jgi:hypothetical protein